MSRRYDSQTTTFSPEGRLYQVEYAMAAIQNAAAAIAIQTKEGIVIATENKIIGKLLAPPKSSEKVYKVDGHIICAVAGLTSDANILLSNARVQSQRYRYTYGEDQPVEELVKLLCDYKHSYTQHGGLRPFGVSFLFAGWDRHYGYQIYESDPSGNYSGWKATAIGSNSTSVTASFKTEYNEDMSLSEATTLALKNLTKAMDTTNPTAEKIEIVTLVYDETTKKCVQTFFPTDRIKTILDEITTTSSSATEA